MTPAEIEIEITAWDKQQEMLDFRAGLICSVIANLYRDDTKKKDPFKPQDFMPAKHPAPRVQTWQEMKEIVTTLQANLKVR